MSDLGGVRADDARVLVEAGVREALRSVGHRRADVAPLVEAVISRLLSFPAATDPPPADPPGAAARERAHRLAVDYAIDTGRAELALLRREPDPEREIMLRAGLRTLECYAAKRWVRL